MGVTITGEVAEIRRAYRVAARLRDWSLTTVDEVVIVCGTLTFDDPLWLSQPPLHCVIPKTGWTWPILTLQRTGAEVRCALGPREG